MHDPMHVVFDVLRPWPTVREARWRKEPNPRRRRRHRQFGPLNIRAAEHSCAHCDDGNVKDPPPSYHDELRPGAPCPDCAGRGFHRTPFWRRPYFGWHFWRFGGTEWYFPALITLWHVDPETDGTDSSCRNRYRPAWRAAKADNDPLRLWWANFRMHHYDKVHVRHWRVQICPVQALRRRLFTRCAGCGERLPYGYSPISSHWDAPPHRWWESEVGVYHHECYDAHRAAQPQEVA